MFKQKLVIVVFLLSVSLMVTQTMGFAAPPQQSDGEDYTVQADDWLSKIADKTYGDLLAFPAIVTATNQKAATDDSYALITNPDVIEIGQKLYLPPASEVEALLTRGDSFTRDSGLTVTVQDEVGRLIEAITVELASGATAEDFLAANQVIQDEYASQQPGYLSRETGVSEGGQWWIAIQWETQADSDASIAGFGEAPGLEDFMTTLNPETMIITQYELKSGADQSTFPGTGAVEVITMRLQDGADVDGFLAANKVIRDEYASQQPGFIARQTGVTTEGDWVLVVHWESKADAEASIAGFGEAPGLEEFSSFINFETMVNTIYEIQQ